MKKIIVANWKMNPLTEREAVRIARAEDKNNVVIVPPFPFLGAVRGVLKNASLGAQDAFFEEKGAYTGEVSSAMLKKFGVRYAIVGHSERRRLGESDEMIAKKAKAGVDAGLKVILCVGEPMDIRRRGRNAAGAFIRKQLSRVKRSKSLIVAYEPIWAIGTGKNADPEEAAYVADVIRKMLHVPVLYGGSTNSRNAKSFLEKKEITGLLVGGASIDPKEFKKMAVIARDI